MSHTQARSAPPSYRQPPLTSQVPLVLSKLWLVILLLVGSAATGAFAAPASAPGDYRLGAGDLLHITVSGYTEMITDVRVSESGSITYPFIGEVKAANLSTQQLEGIISKRLGDGGFIKDAQVTVLVSEYQGQKISVMGQVAKPGQYPLTSSAKVLDLLAAAGGAVPLAAADQATLIRKDGTKATIDLQSLFEGDPTQNPTVSGGDTIYVPRAPQFYIYGEVQKPGMYRLERNMTAVARHLSRRRPHSERLGTSSCREASGGGRQRADPFTRWQLGDPAGRRHLR